jgi:DNA invertase Pin-like site-specific DNA recombinase
VYDPNDPMGKMFFNILATFAEFEVDLIRLRTREGMAIARKNGRLKGKQPKLSPRQRSHLLDLYEAGEHTISEFAELFAVSRATVYREINRARGRSGLPVAAPLDIPTRHRAPGASPATPETVLTDTATEAL